MKSIALHALRTLVLSDVPEPPPPGPGEVRLSVTRVGICGSDVHYFSTGRIGSQVVQFPFRVGHEFAAIIESVGPGVQPFRTGDRVTVDPAIACDVCDQCRHGRRHTCRNLRFLGCPGQAEGCLCETLVMPVSSVFKVPDDVDDDLTALLEPLAIGCYTARLSAARKTDRIAILGCGPIGLCVLAAFRDAGVAHILMTDPLPARRKAARALGADWVGTPADLQSILPDPDSERSCVVECCGEPDATDQAVELLEPGGRLMLVGIPRETRVSFAIDPLRRRELTIQNVRRQNECVSEAIALLQRHPEKLRALITHRGPPEMAQTLFEMVAAYRDGIIKAILDFA